MRFAAGEATRHAVSLPTLDANGLDPAKRVAITLEQGVGDQVLFTTLLPELERRGVNAVFELDARLFAIYRCSLPGLTFGTPAESEAAFPVCDDQLAVACLPRLLVR